MPSFERQGVRHRHQQFPDRGGHLAGQRVGDVILPLKPAPVDLDIAHRPLVEDSPFERQVVVKVDLAMAGIVGDSHVEPVDCRHGTLDRLAEGRAVEHQQARHRVAHIVCARHGEDLFNLGGLDTKGRKTGVGQ